MADFTDFDLSEQLVANLHELDHITPTPIQEVIIPISAEIGRASCRERV